MPPTISNNENSKSGFKIQRIRSNNFGATGINLRKLFHVRCLEAGTKMWVQRLVERKNAQNSATLDFDREYLRTG